LYGWKAYHYAFDFRCLNPFDLLVKERFLFDWERKYTSHFQNSNIPVNFFSKILHFPSQNNSKLISTAKSPPSPLGELRLLFNATVHVIVSICEMNTEVWCFVLGYALGVGVYTFKK